MKPTYYLLLISVLLYCSSLFSQAISSISFSDTPRECDNSLVIISGDLGFSGLSLGSVLVTDMGSTQEIAIAINGFSVSPASNPFTVTADLGLLPEGNYTLNVQLVGAVFETNTSTFEVNYCCSNATPTTLVSTTTATGVQLSWDAIPNSTICQASGRPLGGPAAFIKGPLIQGAEPTSAFIPLGAVPAGTYEWRVACACFTPFSELDLFSMPSGKISGAQIDRKTETPALEH